MKNVLYGKCVRCGRTYAATPDLTTCACGGILDITYDYDYIKTQLGSRVGNRSAKTGSGAAHHSGNGKKIDGRGANSGGANAKNNYRAGHSSVSVLLAEIRQDAVQATGSGRKKNKRRHGSHEQVNGMARPYAKRGKGGIGGNKYAGSTNKKKRRR